MGKSNFVKAFEKYKFNSVFFRYMLTFFIIISLALFSIVTAFVKLSISQRHRDEVAQYEKKVDIFKTEYDNVMSQIYLSFYAVANDSAVDVILEPHSFTNKEYISSYSKLNEKFSLFSLRTNSIYSVYLYSPANDYVYVLTQTDASSDFYDYFSDVYIFEEYTSDGRNVIFNKDSNSLSYVYEVTRGDGTIGYFAYSINLDLLAKRFDLPILLLDKNAENIIYSSNDELSISYSEAITLFEDEKNSININNNNLYMALASEYTSSGISTGLIFLIVISAVLLSLILSYLSAMLLYYNIEKVCNLVSSPFDSQEINKYKNTNEFSYIVSEVHSIASQAHKFKMDLSDKTYQLKQVQANALQYQISPHFLLNTLNLINSIALAEFKQDSKVTTVVDLLSKMLYTVLNIADNIVSLQEEMDYINDYLKIQQLKYYNFDISVNIPDDLLNIRIVKFTLQPIIENAIHYGISTAENGCISITASETDNKCIITVSNNGKIISSQRAEEVNNHILSESQPSSSIGLWNTNRRIKLLFGDEYGLYICAENNLTKVIITLPVEYIEA